MRSQATNLAKRNEPYKNPQDFPITCILNKVLLHSIYTNSPESKTFSFAR